MKHIFTHKFLSSVVAVGALFGIIVVVNILSTKLYFRRDLTEDKLYTLSAGTRKAIAALPEIVNLKLFYSSSLPDLPAGLKSYAERVQDVLQEYKRYSGGNIELEVYDPKPDSDAEEWAQKYGIGGSPLHPLDQEDLFYFGIAVEAAGKQASIPFLNPEREPYLEYDLSRMIYEVTHPKKKVIGVMSSLPVLGTSPEMQAMMQQMQMPREQKKAWVFIDELRKTFSVRDVPSNEFPIADLDVLLVIHPKQLPDSTLFAIDQYVLNGGKAIFFVDPFCVVDAADSGMGFRMPTSSDLAKLFHAYGIDVPERKIVADMDNATQVSGANGRAEKSPLWISVTPEMLNKDDMVCAQLNLMVIPVGGRVASYGNVTNELIPLIRSSRNVCELDSFAAQQGSDEVRKQFLAANERYNLAVKVRGRFASAFPDGNPAEPGASNTFLRVAKGACTIAVVADVDMLADEFNFQELNFFGMKTYLPFNNNIDFLQNAVDQFAGDDNLIAIRSRAQYQRPFTVVQDLERKAQEQWLAKEKELSGELEDVRRKLNELQMKKDASQRFILSAEQQQTIKEFEQRKIEIARELKDVRKNLRKDIDRLGVSVKFCNLALIPLLVCLFGIGLAFYRMYKVKQS